MEDTYRGESPAKKYARFRCWSAIFNEMGPKFAQGKHLVLASREAGDVSTLLGLGVPPKNIVAVERSSSAAYAAQEKYPQVQVVCRDVVKIAREYKRTLSSAYLDFCGTLTDTTIKNVCQVALLGLKDDAHLAVTMLVGREQGELRDEVLKQKANGQSGYLERSDRQVVLDVLEALRGDRGEDAEYKSRLSHALSDAECTSAAADQIRMAAVRVTDDHASPIARMQYLRLELLKRLLPHRMTVHPIEIIHYNSHNKKGNGMPMCVVVFRTRRYLRSMPERKFKAYSNRFGSESGVARIRDCNMEERELRSLVLSMAEEEGSSSLEPLAQIFNLQKQTIIAWKAHSTRGTYAQENQR